MKYQFLSTWEILVSCRADSFVTKRNTLYFFDFSPQTIQFLFGPTRSWMIGFLKGPIHSSRSTGCNCQKIMTDTSSVEHSSHSNESGTFLQEILIRPDTEGLLPCVQLYVLFSEDMMILHLDVAYILTQRNTIMPKYHLFSSLQHCLRTFWL